MDLSKLTVGKAEEGVWLDILHPSANVPFDPPVRVLLLGEDSAHYRGQQHKINNKRIQQAFAANRGQVKQFVTSEEMDVDTIHSLSTTIKDWENVEWNGSPMPCNEKNAAIVLKEVPWMREQIKEFVENRSNFFEDSNPISVDGQSGDSM